MRNSFGERLMLIDDNRFCICNFTNAIFFWAILPETAGRPLEEMEYLFKHAPLFVPGMKRHDLETHDLERRVEVISEKLDITTHRETVTEEN